MKIRFTLLYILLLLISTATFADDVGIAEVRLIEEDNNIYALEVDVSPFLLNTIQRPIIPERCSFIGNAEKVSVGQMLVIRYRFTSGSSPLQPDDELLLYWQRSGIILTTYWQDGTSHRVFFDRELAGIRVPVSQLREVKITQSDLLFMGVKDAIVHLGKMWLIHVLLIVACISIGSVKHMVWLLLAFSAGHGISLVATDLGTPSIFPGGIAILMGLAALLMFVFAVYSQDETRRFWPVLLLLGFLHGLSYTDLSSGHKIVNSSLQLVTARFAFNTTIDILHAVSGGVLWALFYLFRKYFPENDLAPGTNFNPIQSLRQRVIYLAGGLALAAILIFIPDALSPKSTVGNTSIPSISGNPNAGSATRTASRSVDVEDPLMGFITVTPFEIRCEWLIRVRDLNPPTVQSESGEELLPVAVQAEFKDDLLKRFSKETIISADGQQLIANDIRADFVTVASYGVSTRNAPVPEPLDKAVIGLSLAYVVDDAPRQVSLSLLPYPKTISGIPVTFTDPWGSKLHRLSDEVQQTSWNRRMAGFRRPVIRAVSIEPVSWPVLSLLMLIIMTGIVYFIRHRWQKRIKIIVLLIGFLVVMGTYPFVRAEVPPVLTSRVPAQEEIEQALNQLLTNIYRAFDYRTEEAIYDRLAISATGDQLASIYLQHRSAMEIENRGGARASVDNVEVLEIFDVRSSEAGISVHAAWMVSGSVNHFGHIHYRKNRYKSLVHITSSEGVWKISGVEVEEEERVL